MCHHESAVTCEQPADYEDLHSETSKNISEQPDNSIDAISKLDDPPRFKREKLTEELKVSQRKKAKLNAFGKKKKIQIIKKKKTQNRNKEFKKSSEKKQKEKKQFLKNSNKNLTVSEVTVDNCRDGSSLCKSFRLKEEEIGENTKLLVDKDNKEKRTGVVTGRDDVSLARLENVRNPQTSLLIPSLVNDTGKLSEDPTIQKPIKSDSDEIQNTNTGRPPISHRLPKLKLRTRPLDKIPFSRVVAAQKKINGQFSPYISFPELLTNLTKSQRSVRKVDTMIYLTELWTMK